ncbi:hypothetical protein AJ80_08721 [Polytolypa hystricis UAMH7299]|uniref:Uncharacterized protein n=1 Tax=Polytolypa hystricis (strain UAMH7299) TaxID=1447883 RepID=A0A2B7X2U8_POLH7|nr:hypothetical protein AJ80_08721 [Polytolypa hystricis UAMH7299]
MLFHLPLLLLASLVSAATYSNPIKDPNGSDPHIVYTGGYYYLTTTTWTDVQLTRATTIEGLKNGERKVVWQDSTPSRCCNVWAPELHYLDGIWYLYYTAGNNQDLNGQRQHVLRGGSSPWDSYSYNGQVDNDWSIDGTILRFPQGNYFVWSCFMNGSPQSLCIAQMNSPNSLGPRHLLSQPTESWERVQNPVNEGPAPMYHGGKTFLAYSASDCWTASYQIGLLTYTSGDPLQASSWRKTGPHFSSSNGNYGTAHNQFFQSPDGTEIWNVYHATRIANGNCGGERYTMVDKVNWNSDGSPNFGQAQRLGTIQQGPSGE